MKIQEAIGLHVLGHEPLTALIGDRFYPRRWPPKAELPGGFYFQVSRPSEYAHGSALGLVEARWQFSWLARDVPGGKTGYQQVTEIAAASRARFEAWRGTMGGAGGVAVTAVFLDNEFDDDDPETGLALVVQDFLIRYQE